MAAGSAGGGTGATDPDWDDDAMMLPCCQPWRWKLLGKATEG